MPRFASPEEKLPDSGVYFLPDAHGRAYLSLERWSELKERVRAGATLYISWNDTFLDSMEEVGGIEIAFREQAGGSDMCDFGDFRQRFGYSVKRRFNALTAEVLAKNQNGEGVFFRNRYGKGTVYVFAHNFELAYYAAAGKYESDAWKVWAKVCPVERILAAGDKNIFVSEHHFGDGRCGLLVVNNSGRAYSGVPAVKKSWRIANAVTDDGGKAKWDGSKLTLSPCSGILLIAENVGR